MLKKAHLKSYCFLYSKTIGFVMGALLLRDSRDKSAKQRDRGYRSRNFDRESSSKVLQDKEGPYSLLPELMHSANQKAIALYLVSCLDNRSVLLKSTL